MTKVISEQTRVNETQRSFTRAKRKAKTTSAAEFRHTAVREDTTERTKGAWGMPAALGGEEGRDKLRKATERGKYPVTRGCPNGATQGERFPYPENQEANAGN